MLENIRRVTGTKVAGSIVNGNPVSGRLDHLMRIAVGGFLIP
jgi:hypothetical protein